MNTISEKSNVDFKNLNFLTQKSIKVNSSILTEGYNILKQLADIERISDTQGEW